ncbi:hypothetical protein ESCO106044_24155 [Escherichia coli]
MWLAENEGAKFWLNVLTELKNRGLNDILIACVDGLKGFPEAINAVYPETQIQLCIVHMVRNSLRFVAWKDYKAVTPRSHGRRRVAGAGCVREGMGCTVPADKSQLAGKLAECCHLLRVLGGDRKRLTRTVLIFTESSDQLSRATDRVPGLPASPGYVQ